MTYGTFQGMTWPVDTEDVEWKFRHMPHEVTDRDRAFATSVMEAYRRLTSPSTGQERAQEFLSSARVVVDEVWKDTRQAQAEKVRRDCVVVWPDGINVSGPFTEDKARELVERLGGGSIRRLHAAE